MEKMEDTPKRKSPYAYDKEVARENYRVFASENAMFLALGERMMVLGSYVAEVGCSEAFRRKLKNLKMSMSDFEKGEKRPSRLQLFAYNRAVDVLIGMMPSLCDQKYLDLLAKGDASAWIEQDWDEDFPALARLALDFYEGKVERVEA